MDGPKLMAAILAQSCAIPGWDINTPLAKNRWNAWHCACGNGEDDLVRLVLDLGRPRDPPLDPNRLTADGFTGLSRACWAGHVATVRLILQELAPGPADLRLGCPLHWACSQRRADVVRALAAAPAIDANWVPRREDTLCPGLSPFCGVSPLFVACQNGCLGAVEALLSVRGIDVNCGEPRKDITPLQIASRNGHTDVVLLLCKNGATAPHFPPASTTPPAPHNLLVTHKMPKPAAESRLSAVVATKTNATSTTVTTTDVPSSSSWLLSPSDIPCLLSPLDIQLPRSASTGIPQATANNASGSTTSGPSSNEILLGAEVKKLLEELKAKDTAINNLKAKEAEHCAEIEQLIEQLKVREQLNSMLQDRIKEKERLNTHFTCTAELVTSLIGVDIDSFRLKEFLGSGSQATAFLVQFVPSTVIPQSSSRFGNPNMMEMAMKVVLNWDETDRQTLIKQKYMKECSILSSLPLHPNVAHPLGFLVIPQCASYFVNAIPPSHPVYKALLANNKSLAFLFPYAGVRLSDFLHSFTDSSTVPGAAETILIVKHLFAQALRAVCHIEGAWITHRDIKSDNILVDPKSRHVTLIDFSEAEQCFTYNLELYVSKNIQLWGNAVTMPPEVSQFTKTLTTTQTTFSYTKCDSFALAFTFYDLLLPESAPLPLTTSTNNDRSAFDPLQLHPLPEWCSRFGTDILIPMMSHNRKTRMSATTALSLLS